MPATTLRQSELNGIDDSFKGETRYRYDLIGRLKGASTPLGEESFAFDPAGNLIAVARPNRAGVPPNTSTTPMIA